MKKLASLFCLLFITVGVSKGKSNTRNITVESVVEKTNIFIESLSADQQKAVLVDYIKENATKWTNLPCGLQCRVGILLGSLTKTQLQNAKAIVKEATGTLRGRGYDQVMQILMADGFLGEKREGYSSGNYIIAFIGKPSTIGRWQLQFGGHHLAVNLTFDKGKIIGTSPLFLGLEPKTWTSDGITYSPLKANHDNMTAILSSMDSNQLATANLRTTFSDVTVGPGMDGKFPKTKAGLKIGTLSKLQKTLVIEAIRVWVQIADEETSKSLLALYTKELNDTYIAYAGNRSLDAKGDYIRIDGPDVWIEFICQPGAVFPAEVHYHTVYRDHVRDYGHNFTFFN